MSPMFMMKGMVTLLCEILRNAVICSVEGIKFSFTPEETSHFLRVLFHPHGLILAFLCSSRNKCMCRGRTRVISFCRDYFDKSVVFLQKLRIVIWQEYRVSAFCIQSGRRDRLLLMARIETGGV